MAWPAPRERRLGGLFRGGDDLPVEPGDRDRVARLGDGAARLGDQARIDLLQELGRGGLGLHGRPVVDVMADRDLGGDFGHAAEMIAVPMGCDQVVDLGQAGILDRRHDPRGVALGGVRGDVAGVHQHGLARGRDKQRGVSALDVDDIDVERGPGRRGLGVGAGHAEAEQSGAEQQGCASSFHPPDWSRPCGLRLCAECILRVGPSTR